MNTKKIQKKQFRLRGKKLYLIYPQLNQNIKSLKETILKQLQIKIQNIENYLISEKYYQDSGVYIYCFFEMLTPIDICNINYFDIKLNDIKYHGNYKIGKQKKLIIENLIKENNFITNMKLPIKNKKLLTPEEHLFNVCVESGYTQAEKILYEYYPILALKRGHTLLKNLSLLNKYLNINKSIK
uniref:Uncharacterized protein n=1 Tax=Phytophthora nicotianae TaxID=4792 RepID=G9CPN8_PHYNI|nr:hypothetical protein [Phytophthora nicotianae]AEH68268.1 hypothetical protein [Phytophthora nicotianae]AEH68269.1 hypothetical protein [Phytophthora nicotianae]AEH68270.1 hypothetical protein [Phytophthora nicotianae]AEH68271.1 hypothetical protein [Phytophthora nicotianae]